MRDELEVPLERCIPARHTWASLVPPLTPGEMTLACKLDDELPAGWTVAVQRKISNAHPDILCFHPRNGIIIVEVKDWDPGARSFEIRESGVWATNRSGGPIYRTDDPVGQVMHYKEILSQTFPRYTDAEILITVVVAMTRMPDAQVRSLFSRLVPTAYRKPAYQRYAVLAGTETLQRPVTEWLPCSNGEPNPNLETYRRELKLSGNTARRISWLLRVPELETEQHEPLQLDAQKREFLRNPNGASRRKVKGAVGSGKSTLLAASAAKAVSEGKRVLVISFTITLRHWLHRLIVRAGMSVSGMGHADFSERTKSLVSRWYVHEFAKELAATAGRFTEMQRMIGSSTDYPAEEIFHLSTETVRDARCRRAHKYDLVLVDEIQNVDVRWLEVLGQCVAEDGEMVIFGDVTQNVYGLNVSWTARPVTGFPGRWTELRGSYRFPPAMYPVLRDFYDCFNLESEGADSPELAETGLFDSVDLLWVRADTIAMAGIAAEQLLKAERMGVAAMDTALLALRHEDGLDVLRVLTGEEHPAQEISDYIHVFSHDSRNSAHLKKAFWPMSGQRKLCTVHSFQGWEARYVVLLVSPNEEHETYSQSPQDRESGFDFLRTVYVGLSRLARSERTSTLVVVNAERELDQFLGRHFREVFYREDDPDGVPNCDCNGEGHLVEGDTFTCVGCEFRMPIRPHTYQNCCGHRYVRYLDS